MDRSDDRVIIIGAGPVGLCLALALSKEGVRSFVIEQLSDENFLKQIPRAGTNHPATLEMYDKIGLYEKLEPRGIVAPRFHYWDGAKRERIAEFDHIHLKNDTRFPFVLQCERIKIVEEALAMVKANAMTDVRMGATFTGFTQDSDSVTAYFETGGGEKESLRGRYIVSVEGARSIVRDEMGIEFEGFTYTDRTITIQVAYDFTQHGYAERNYISHPKEYSNLFHWIGPPNCWRVHFPTKPDEEEEALMRPEAMQERLQRLLPTGRPFEIVGRNLYSVHQRVAQEFRQGRAILAGDAAHVNSPIGAMGLNSGVHDAFNLAEKLGRIWRGEGDESLLDLYGRQRRYVAAQHTQVQTIRNKRLLAEKDPAVRQRNHDELRRKAEDPKLAREFLLRTSLFNSLNEAAQIT